MNSKKLRIGTAGWSIPSELRDLFPPGKSLLERYCQLFNAVEINTCFYRPHQKKTYERWAAVTPPDFQFAVKMPKQMTHIKKLVDSQSDLERFLVEISGLGNKLGPLLIQLPPSFSFKQKIVDEFFSLLRSQFKGKVVLEPRHSSWADLEVCTLLQTYYVECVLADPVRVNRQLNKEQLFTYYRLHGSPKIYTSSYDSKFLEQLAKQLNDLSWVIFDNTKFGWATKNALDLKQLN